MIGVAIWAWTLGVLIAYHGGNGGLAQMGWFFTKAALLTFGARLPSDRWGREKQN
ncbi:MAG: hypothetical protein ACREYF_29230 [Gammaproteobacteria bacterium]